MPILQSFRATVYSGDLDPAQVTTPPYDVISPAERERLRALHPHNMVHLTLGSASRNGTDVHGHRGARRRLEEWVRAGVLVPEGPAAMYLYRMDHREGGRERSTAGVVGTLTLEGLGEGGIFPHERTFPGPVADRLELMRAAQANLEPIWLVAARSSDALGALAEAVPGANDRGAPARKGPSGQAPIVDLSDAGGIRHRLWRIAKEGAERVAEALSTTPLVIADGHHRYAAALAFRDEERTRAGPGPWDQTLALISDPVRDPPSLLPIHRVARVSVDRVASAAELTAFRGGLEALASHVREAGPGTIGVASSRGCWTMKSEGPLDSAWVGTHVLEPLGADLSYEHEIEQVSSEIAAGAVGFILAPVPVGLVLETALAGRLMPQKTTLFWPKPRTGLLLRDLEA
jgi:uncharacterized protein (DUF1015 family)